MSKIDKSSTVFVVDDDPAVRTSLARALIMRGYMVETFGSARDFLDDYETHFSGGCLILDYGMPGMSGLELQDHLNRNGHNLPTIFITGHGGIPESVQAMKGGALDFLEKPFKQSDLMERVRAALDVAALNRTNAQAQIELQGRFERLTPRESEIVDHILANPGEISSKEIGRHLDISPRTVDHHRARILEKLNVASVVELIDLARRADYYGRAG
ncbi:response regulator [Paracoccus sp. Z330]|uniref:Response regulator n=1 Tax=Paracoccus onchidii TaxID=3017813 RepID=A0ABT4ZKU4_9RHOB|nr:response regulator [Paracoccus onchidii]MDB6179356.1 response regulator [Paracoccus onchidii]